MVAMNFLLTAHPARTAAPGIRRVKSGGRMPQKQKINLEKVKASLDTLYPKCGYAIAPDQLRRVDFNQIECPQLWHKSGV
jgi:hypothetical protein